MRWLGKFGKKADDCMDAMEGQVEFLPGVKSRQVE